MMRNSFAVRRETASRSRHAAFVANAPRWPAWWDRVMAISSSPRINARAREAGIEKRAPRRPGPVMVVVVRSTRDRDAPALAPVDVGPLPQCNRLRS